MNKNIRRLLYELTRNSRITTKELSTHLRISQQACSYLVNRLKKKKWIKECTVIVDAVKLGFTTVLVGFDFTSFDREIKKEILDYFKNNGSITAVEEAKQGVDLLVEYSSSNLSAFNKTYSEAVEKFKKVLKTRFVLPIIVKHKFRKNYLANMKDETDLILCGDRNIIHLSEKENTVLKELASNPDIKLVHLAKKTKIPVKLTAAIKKRLEKKRIIRGYSCVLDNQKFGIRRYHLFLKLDNPSAKDISKIREYSRMNKHIIRLIKILGPYHILLTIEELKNKEIITEIREHFQIEDYFVVESGALHKKTYLPLTD